MPVNEVISLVSDINLVLELCIIFLTVAERSTFSCLVFIFLDMKRSFVRKNCNHLKMSKMFTIFQANKTSAWFTHPVVINMFCSAENVGDEDSAHPVMQHTFPLCLCELGVDDVSRLNQCSAGLDHLEDKEGMLLVCITSQHHIGVIP